MVKPITLTIYSELLKKKFDELKGELKKANPSMKVTNDTVITTLITVFRWYNEKQEVKK